MQTLLLVTMVPLVLGLYVILLWFGIPTAEYVALVVGPTMSVAVGFVMVRSLTGVKETIVAQHAETSLVLSNQNVKVATLARVVAARVHQVALGQA